jgi:hypothetical protein
MRFFGELRSACDLLEFERSVEWWLVTDVSGQPIRPIFKDKAAFLVILLSPSRKMLRYYLKLSPDFSVLHVFTIISSIPTKSELK